MSLKLDIISLESLTWTLKSLQLHEMTPSEKAIQNRLKEAFAYKMPTEIWISIFHVISNPQYEESAELDYSQLFDPKVIQDKK